MPQPPKPEDDRHVLQAKAHVLYGAFGAVAIVGLSQAAGYDPKQAASALRNIGLATPLLLGAAINRAKAKTIDTIQNNVTVRGRGKTMPTVTVEKRGGVREELPTELGKGDRGRARPKRDRGR